MKTQVELNELKEEVETMNKKLQELTEEELMLVTGGGTLDFFLTYVAVGGCGFSSEIRKTTNKCTQSNICSFTNIECQYR